MKKKFLCMLIVMLALVCVFASCGKKDKDAASTDENPQGLAFCLKDDGTYAVEIGYAKYLSKIEIPATYNGKAVTEVGRFSDDNGNAVLAEIVIPNSVITIGNYAFRYCSNLTRVTIPDSIITIGEDAFRGCSNLTSVTIPNSVISIGSGAFGYCSNLTRVTIPDSVTTIGGYAFAGCTALIYNEHNNIYYLGNATNPYVYLAVVKSFDRSSYVIHKDTKFIGSSAFSGCTSLTGIAIPDNVRSIGNSAFSGCSSLTDVTIGESVTALDYSVFRNCRDLTNIEVDEANTAYRSFYGNLYSKDGTVLIAYACGKLDETFIIPDFVTTIGDYAFYYCSNLTNVTIGNSVTSIGWNAFEGCTRLETAIFVNPNGWWCGFGDGSTRDVELLASELSYTYTAAYYLWAEYCWSCYWYRTE